MNRILSLRQVSGRLGVALLGVAVFASGCGTRAGVSSNDLGKTIHQTLAMNDREAFGDLIISELHFERAFKAELVPRERFSAA